MTTSNPDVVLDELYNAEFPRHERTSCSDEDPSNASPDGFGCKRCNAIIHLRAERLQAECEKLRNLAAECAEYLNYSPYTRISHSSVLHRKLIAAAMQGDKA